MVKSSACNAEILVQSCWGDLWRRHGYPPVHLPRESPRTEEFHVATVHGVNKEQKGNTVVQVHRLNSGVMADENSGQES